MKSYRAEYIKLVGLEDYVVGLLLAENDDWLLMRKLPEDYVADGYILVAKAHIEARGVDQKRRQITRVLKLKGITTEIPIGFTFGSPMSMMRWIEQCYKLFQIQDEEDTCFCGQLRDCEEEGFRIKALSPRAKMDLDYNNWFKWSDLMTIEFGTDYLCSLILLWEDKARRKWNVNLPNQQN